MDSKEVAIIGPLVIHEVSVSGQLIHRYFSCVVRDLDNLIETIFRSLQQTGYIISWHEDSIAELWKDFKHASLMIMRVVISRLCEAPSVLWVAELSGAKL